MNTRLTSQFIITRLNYKNKKKLYNTALDTRIVNIEKCHDIDKYDDTPPDRLIKVSLSIKNNSNAYLSISFLDFKFLNKKGQKIDVYTHFDNLGIELSPHQQIIGHVYLKCSRFSITSIAYNSPFD